LRVARAAGLVCVLAAMAGCATLARQAFRTPTVDLRDVRVRALGLEGGSVDVMLDVFNPNDYRIDATKLTYTLFADTSLVAEGAVTKRVTLKNRDHNDVVLPVSFTFRELLAAAEVMTRKGTVDYTVKGEVTVDSPFGSVTRPYQAKARLDNASLLPP
jgi:LEA14-like dessication related protein